MRKERTKEKKKKERGLTRKWQKKFKIQNGYAYVVD